MLVLLGFVFVLFMMYSLFLVFLLMLSRFMFNFGLDVICSFVGVLVGGFISSWLLFEKKVRE